jgi:hypothetical protein
MKYVPVFIDTSKRKWIFGDKGKVDDLFVGRDASEAAEIGFALEGLAFWGVVEARPHFLFIPGDLRNDEGGTRPILYIDCKEIDDKVRNQ